LYELNIENPNGRSDAEGTKTKAAYVLSTRREETFRTRNRVKIEEIK
jgi:hypothetical protein